jgi:Domain of unknown function (DUF4349)
MKPLELEDIGAELREGRPAPTRDFAAELDAWAAEGFPRPEKPRQQKPRPQRRRWVLPAFGATVTAALVIGIVLTQQGGQVDQAQKQEPGGATSLAPPAPSGDAAASQRELRLPERPGRGALQPIQEKSASMMLSTEPDEVAGIAQDATEVTQRYGGIVDAMSVRTDDSEAKANLELRIPVQHLDAALTELSGLAQVESRDEALLDITKSYNSAGKRFNNAQRKVNELLAALAATDDPGAIAGLRAELRVARQRLTAARAALRDNKQRGNFARVSLAVISSDADPGSSLGDAATDAVDVLEAIGGAILIGLAVAIPLGALGAAIWFGSASLRRRRRESILDRE